MTASTPPVARPVTTPTSGAASAITATAGALRRPATIASTPAASTPTSGCAPCQPVAGRADAGQRAVADALLGEGDEDRR